MTKDEAVQRYKAAHQDVTGKPPAVEDAYITSAHATAIRALMDAGKPLPVGPDLLLARKIVAEAYERDGWADFAARVRNGLHDNEFAVRTTLAGIRAGKAMR